MSHYTGTDEIGRKEGAIGVFTAVRLTRPAFTTSGDSGASFPGFITRVYHNYFALCCSLISTTPSGIFMAMLPDGRQPYPAYEQIRRFSAVRSRHDVQPARISRLLDPARWCMMPALARFSTRAGSFRHAATPQ